MGHDVGLVAIFPFKADADCRRLNFVADRLDVEGGVATEAEPPRIIMTTTAAASWIEIEPPDVHNWLSADELPMKDAGKFQVEGKEYVVSDGDIMHVRFNV